MREDSGDAAPDRQDLDPPEELQQASEDDADPYARQFAIEQLTGPGDEDD